MSRSLALVVAMGFPIALAACVTAADSIPTKSRCPPADDFHIVSQVLERRCGTLDCHGVTERPMRIYGRTGLRLPDNSQGGDYVVGGMVETTDAEVNANYLAACGLEPERMANVVARKAEITTLTLVRKPRLQESHKGGMVLPEGSSGDKCLTSWIAGKVNDAACVDELMKP